MIREILSNVKEAVLNGYGWHIEDPDDYLDTTINPGEYVRFYDDEMDSWNWGVYLGWHQDLSKSGDSSPYINESNEGIDRLVIRDCVINPDGSITLRTNYALPENVYDWYEATSSVASLEGVA